MSIENEASHSAEVQEISHPRFSKYYNQMMERPLMRRRFDPLRRELVGQAHGVVLEVGAGGGQNFPFYDPKAVVRVEAIEPDEVMLTYAGRSREPAPVPITLTRAAVERLPFPDAQFDTVVVSFVLCSVTDPALCLREISRVLKPEGSLLLMEHVRAQGRIAASLQDALVPLTTRFFGNCHWNRDTERILVESGFEVVSRRLLGGGLQPFFSIHARYPGRSAATA